MWFGGQKRKLFLIDFLTTIISTPRIYNQYRCHAGDPNRNRGEFLSQLKIMHSKSNWSIVGDAKESL